MTEATREPQQAGHEPDERPTPPPNGAGRKVVGRPFRPGVSGNPSGRPRIEPRVRRFARRYDRRAVRELFRIGCDPRAPYDTRRRALGDLIAIGSGRPVMVQEVAGRNGEPLAPLVALNFSQPESVTPAEAVATYAAFMRNEISSEAALSVLSAQPAPTAEVSRIEPMRGTVAGYATPPAPIPDSPNLSPPPSIETSTNIPEVPTSASVPSEAAPLPPPRLTREQVAARMREQNEAAVEIENERVRQASAERERRQAAEAERCVE